MSNDNIPEEANELHQKARQLGAAGEYTQAIEVLEQAQKLAPDWPFPTYDMAFTYILTHDFAKARDCYEKTLAMSPRGFFTAITALNTLNREEAGELPVGTYMAYMSLEWINDPEQKANMIRSLVQQVPSFAPAWKEYALLCEDSSEKLEAIEKGLSANPDAETKGILLINKALTLSQQDESERAIEILQDLAADPNSTLSNESLARQMLAMVKPE